MGAQHRFKSKVFLNPGLVTEQFKVEPFERKMLGAMIENLLYIDPDSSRIVDWVTFNRNDRGFSTVVYNHEFRKRTDEEFAIMKAEIKKHFNHYYDSKYMLRCFKIDGVPNPISREEHEKEKHDGKWEPIIPVMKSYLALEMTGQGVAITAIGDPAFNGPIVQGLSELYPDADKLAFVDLLGFAADGSPMTSKVELDPEDSSLDLAHNSFYPRLKQHGHGDVNVQRLIDDYAQSKASVMLLWGPRGTGKTTLGRSMCMQLGTGDNIFMCSQENAFMHPNFGLWLEGLPENSLVFIEDADNLVGKRSDGNHQMSMILNKADGIVKRGLKLVFSTNLSTFQSIDEALLRPGRCYGVFKFDKLSLVEANEARAVLNLDPITDGIKGEITLAEALNFKGVDDVTSRKYEGMGFISNFDASKEK